jgi:hypothetical protein
MDYLIVRLFYYVYVYGTYTNFVLGLCIYFYAFCVLYFVSYITYNSGISKKKSLSWHPASV